MSDRPTEGRVIDITDRLPKPRLQPGQAVIPPARVKVDPDNDAAVDLALQLLGLINQKDREILHILLALNLLSNTMYAEFLQDLGRKDFMRLAALAQGLARHYEPVFHERRHDDAGRSSGPEEGTDPT